MRYWQDSNKQIGHFYFPITLQNAKKHHSYHLKKNDFGIDYRFVIFFLLHNRISKYCLHDLKKSGILPMTSKTLRENVNKNLCIKRYEKKTRCKQFEKMKKFIHVKKYNKTSVNNLKKQYWSKTWHKFFFMSFESFQS